MKMSLMPPALEVVSTRIGRVGIVVRKRAKLRDATEGDARRPLRCRD